MSETIKGKITFINHEKKYAMAEYEQGNKKKTVRVAIDEKTQKAMKDKKLIRKTHHFMTGDVVSFQIKLSDRGDRMEAVNTEFLYNNALDALIDKSRLNNRFLGYLKQVDDDFFVKEIDSYLFFPVPFSPWQLAPSEEDLNEQVTFSLENTDKKEKIFATLSDNKYIPEFKEAVKLFKSKTAIDAEVYKITPHSLYIHIVGDQINGKLPFDEKAKIGDKIRVVITYLGKTKIAVESAG